MKKLLQKLRGLAGVGITWGTMWSLIGGGIGIVIGVVRPEVWQWTNPIFDWMIGMGLYGFVSGVGFGSLLALREGKKTLQDLSLWRVAKWGILGAAAVPLLFGALGTFAVGTSVWDVLGAMLVTGSLGGLFAPTSVALARRAELGPGDERKRLS